MKCFECGKKIDILADTCPFCGAEQFDDKPPVERVVRQQSSPKINVRLKRGLFQPIFSNVEELLFGIHPNDKTYKDLLELSVLTDSGGRGKYKVEIKEK
ncbi:MAG: hypothetical protein IJ794_19350 [Lachnospiraceae bacterium]|nr:hypothetical protein [Lachnospiraceae bacterium]MBR1855266.1 hypothetical protein [Lachnospiraceae bacterium]